MTSNGDGQFPDLVSRAEMVEFAAENLDMLNGIRLEQQKFAEAHNTLAEVCMLHRYLFEKFMPGPLLAAAIKEYRDKRELMIAEDAARAEALRNVPRHLA